MTKYLLIVIILFSSLFAEGPGNKRWKKRYNKKHRSNKHKIHRVVHYPKSNIRIKYGYYWCLTPWRNLCSKHNHNNVAIIKNEKISLDNASDIFEKIEQLGTLKDKNLITEKEFEKAKKELLKRI